MLQPRGGKGTLFAAFSSLLACPFLFIGLNSRLQMNEVLWVENASSLWPFGNKSGVVNAASVQHTTDGTIS